jgi:hypothetical protein
VSAPEYRFVSRWEVLGTPDEVSDVLTDTRELPRWWPSTYLEAEVLDEGDEKGVGKRVRLHTKGWLPYTLRWELEVTESRHPNGFSIAAKGDLAGEGIWTFEPSGAWTLVRYDWRVRAEKPLLAVLSPVLRPLFEANHRWAMARGEESLELELARRRAATPSEKARIPPPPMPTTSSPLPLLAGAAAAAIGAFAVARLVAGGRRRRRRFGRGGWR